MATEYSFYVEIHRKTATGFNGRYKQLPRVMLFLIILTVDMININAWNVNVVVPQNSIIHQMTWLTTETLP